MIRTLFNAIVATVLVCAVSAPAQASLIGSTVTLNGVGVNGSTTAVVGNGVEFPGGMVGYMAIDIGATTITLNFPQSVGWGDFGYYTFTGFADTITGLTLVSNTGMNGGINSGNSFGAHSISLHIGQGSASAGSQVVFNVATTSVPEPESVLLLGLGLAGVALARRRKVKQA